MPASSSSAAPASTFTPAVLLALGPTLMTLLDVVQPPAFEELYLLRTVIVGFGILTALAAVLQPSPHRQALGTRDPVNVTLVALGVAAAALGILKGEDFVPYTFWEEVLVRLPAAVIGWVLIAIAVRGSGSRRVHLAGAGLAGLLLLHTLTRPIATELMVAASLDAPYGPLSPETAAAWAFGGWVLVVRAGDGVLLLVGPLLWAAERTPDKASALRTAPPPPQH